MNYYIFLIVLILLSFISLWIGKREARVTKTQDDYYLSGRKIGFLNLTLTFLATQLGGGAIVGSAEAALTFGWSAIYYSAGLATGLTVLSLGVGAVFRRMEIRTIPEIFKKVYDSPFLQKIASIFTILSFFFVLIAVGVAARKFFVSIELGNPLIFSCFWFAVILYTVLGGLGAVVKTDRIQAGFIMVVFFVTFLYLWFLPSTTNLEIMVNASEKTEFIPWTSWLLMPFMFVLIAQDMGQRCFAGKSPKVVSLSAAAAGVLLVICSLLPIYIALLGQQIGVIINGDESVLLKTIERVTNPTMMSLFACAIFMAIISTADSLLCAISSNLSLDFNWPLRKQNDRTLTIAKSVTLFVGLIAMAFAYSAADIIPLMVFAYELSVSTLFVPIIMAVIFTSPSRIAAYSAMTVGFICFISFKFIDPLLPREVLTILFSFMGFGFANVWAYFRTLRVAEHEG